MKSTHGGFSSFVGTCHRPDRCERQASRGTTIALQLEAARWQVRHAGRRREELGVAAHLDLLMLPLERQAMPVNAKLKFKWWYFGLAQLGPGQPAWREVGRPCWHLSVFSLMARSHCHPQLALQNYSLSRSDRSGVGRLLSPSQHRLLTLTFHCTPTMVREHVNFFCRVLLVAPKSTFAALLIDRTHLQAPLLKLR
jgi:hypothetical protein